MIDNLERALDGRRRMRPPTTRWSRASPWCTRSCAGGSQSAGVESFDPTGEKFDPQLHEALSTQPAEGTESGVVLETVEKGYRLDGQVLRPAKVVVSE